MCRPPLQLFLHLDSNRNASIKRSEIRDLLRMLNEHPSEEQFEKFYRFMDIKVLLPCPDCESHAEALLEVIHRRLSPPLFGTPDVFDQNVGSIDYTAFCKALCLPVEKSTDETLAEARGLTVMLPDEANCSGDPHARPS